MQQKSFAEVNRTALIILVMGVVLLIVLLRNLDSGLVRYILQGFRNFGSLLGING